MPRFSLGHPGPTHTPTLVLDAQHASDNIQMIATKLVNFPNPLNMPPDSISLRAIFKSMKCLGRLHNDWFWAVLFSPSACFHELSDLSWWLLQRRCPSCWNPHRRSQCLPGKSNCMHPAPTDGHCSVPGCWTVGASSDFAGLTA